MYYSQHYKNSTFSLSYPQSDHGGWGACNTYGGWSTGTGRLTSWKSRLLFGNGRDNTLKGTEADEFVFGLGGDDDIDSGAGRDLVFAGWGNDTIIHNESDNSGATNWYSGQFGHDTLRLNVSRETYESEAFRDEWSGFQKRIDLCGTAGGYFSTLGVGFSSFEAIEVAIEGPPLPTTFGFTVAGIDAVDASGLSVTSAGDFNDDGIDDILIGAPFADPSGESIAGESYILFGGQEFGDTVSLATLGQVGGAAGSTLNGIDMFDGSGNAVSSAGDVNNDGIDDILIGISPPGNDSPGESYIVFGGQNLPTAVDLETLGQIGGAAGFRLIGVDDGDASGFSVASAGDINDDGIDDILIGAYQADQPGALGAGESYVVFGGQSFGAVVDLATLGQTGGLAGFLLAGVDADDGSGYSVDAAGDVDGDGIDDLLIGTRIANQPGAARAGESYVVFGGQTFGSQVDLATLGQVGGADGFTLTGVAADELSGVSVASVGDVNDDGFDDIVIGTLLSGGYVVFGGQSFGATIDLATVGQASGTAGFTLSIDGVDSLAGLAVASAGDLNGDGIDDLVIGEDRSSTEAGTSYVVLGGQSFGADVELSTLGQPGGAAGYILNGIDDGGLSAASVASAGDINDDGIGDLLIGAPAAGAEGTGETYVVYGGTDILDRFDASDGTVDGQIMLANLGLNPADFDLFA